MPAVAEGTTWAGVVISQAWLATARTPAFVADGTSLSTQITSHMLITGMCTLEPRMAIFLLNTFSIRVPAGLLMSSEGLCGFFTHMEASSWQTMASMPKACSPKSLATDEHSTLEWLRMAWFLLGFEMSCWIVTENQKNIKFSPEICEFLTKLTKKITTILDF